MIVAQDTHIVCKIIQKYHQNLQSKSSVQPNKTVSEINDFCQLFDG